METPDVKALLKEGELSQRATLRAGPASRGSAGGGVGLPLSSQGSTNTGTCTQNGFISVKC